jgi:RNA polymerase sigma-70 factor (ECF subfamily)
MLAWQRCDLEGLAALLAEDAVLEMPPQSLRYLGRERVARFFGAVPADGRLDRIRLVATRANGQPALAAYLPAADGAYRAYGVMVLVVVDGSIQAITGFQDASLFQAFGLPQTPPEGWRRHLSPARWNRGSALLDEGLEVAEHDRQHARP